ncbi:MAG: hypothetical protein ACFFDS_04470 [Candidatus Thorarchaeota archaeon]
MVAAAITKNRTKVLVNEYCQDKELSKVSNCVIENSSQNTKAQTIHLKSISNQVREQKNAAYHQISRLLGNIHFL